MTVLVTGGAGFIGCSLVRALDRRGDRIRVLDDLSTGLASNLAGIDVDLVEGSITDPSIVRSAMDGVASVVHLAARGSVPRSVADPVGNHAANDTGTLNVLEAARAVGAHVVFSSSSSVYGINTDLPKREEMWTQPMSPYGASKLAAESYVMAYRDVYDLDAVALRFFNVYGPWQRTDHDYAAAIPRFAWRALHGQPLAVHGDGKQTRDFTHVDAVVRVLVDAVDRRVSWPRPVNLAFGDRISINDVVAELSRQLARPLDVVHEPPRPGDVRHSQNDPALLRSVFPSAEPVAFADGIASTLAWLGSTRE